MMVYDQYLYEEKPQVDDDVVIFHSGFCCTRPNYSYGKDTRDYYLIHYCTKGAGTYQDGMRTHRLRANDGFLILPGQTIVHTADKKNPWDLCWIGFFGREVPRLLEAAGLGREHLIFRYQEDDFLEQCVREIYNESRGSRNLASIKGYFYQFLGKLTAQRQKAVRGQAKTEGYGQFDAAMNYIRRNIRLRITVEELARDMRLEASTVYRIFKANTGKSPQQFIHEMRMEKAREYLEKTDLSIKDVAETMDYEYQSHFTKEFKRYAGSSPSQYRARFRQARGMKSDLDFELGVW